MNTKQIQYGLIGVAIIVALIGSYFGIKLPYPSVPEPETRAGYSTACYHEQGGAAFTCDSGGTITANSGATIAVASGGALTLASGSTLTAAGLIKETAVSTTVTNTAFAITGGLVALTATTEVTPTVTIPAAGVTACLYNSGSNTIHLADSGNQVLSAAWNAGQYDTLCLFSDGTRVIETARANN